MRPRPPLETRHFGIALREMRRAAGLKQAALATETGYFETSISNWENGVHYPPSGPVMEALARACNASPVTLYLGAARDTGELRMPVRLETETEQAVAREVIAVAMGGAR